MIGKTSEPTDSRMELWRQRWQRIRAYLKSAGLFGLGIAAALLTLLIYNYIVPDSPQLTMNEVNDSISQAMASATPPPSYSSRVYQAVLPSMVFIRTEVAGEDGEVNHGIGSGVVINFDGDILTSLHVVEGAAEIELSFADGTRSQAEVIIEQPENDIAVLRASQLPTVLAPAVLGNPNAMRVGDEAFVVGHPLGLTGSMSAGVISGFDRSFTPVDSDQELSGLIQIDAAVNPGNSGGPLLNRNGQVVGIVTALANPTEQDFFIGIGFAVPITIAGGAVDLPPY
jgi:S1-C subfamily serine protease